MADEAKATEWPRSKFSHGSVKKISGTATGHNGAPRSVKLNSSLYSKLSLTYTETYRSGHNGADSKSVREQSPASSNLAVSAKTAEIIMTSAVYLLF